MKKYFLFILVSLLYLNSTFAQEESFSALIGKPKAILKSQNKRLEEYTFDDSLTEVFIYGEVKFLTCFIFNDTIIKIAVVNDGTLYDEVSTMDTSYEDKARLQKFQNYFLSTYQTKADFTTVPMGMKELKDKFGLACGSAGTPTEFGKRYLALANKTNTQEDVKKLLLSFNPYERLYGLLLYVKQPYEELATIAQSIRENPHTYNFCSGCMPEPDKTANEISGPNRTEK